MCANVAISTKSDSLNWRDVFSQLRVLTNEQIDALCSADKIVEQERKKGFEEGFRSGHQKGLEDWLSAVGLWQAQEKTLIERQWVQIVSCARLLVERILGKAIEEKDNFDAMLKVALEEDFPAKCLTIYAHPSRRLRVETAVRNLPQYGDRAAVKGDPTVGLNDLRLEYRSHWVDASLSTLIANGSAALIQEELWS
jgi:flagellar biosynthesis/type III secretory pathway protein FliH